MPPPFPPDLPPHEQYADFLDADDWHPVLHGSFAEYADLPEPAVDVHQQEVIPGALLDPPPT